MPSSSQTTPHTTSADRTRDSKECCLTLLAVSLPELHESPELLCSSGEPTEQSLAFYEQLAGWVETSSVKSEPAWLFLAAITEHLRFPIDGAEPGRIKKDLARSFSRMAFWPTVQLLVSRSNPEVPHTRIYGVRIPKNIQPAAFFEQVKALDAIKGNDFFGALDRELCYSLLLSINWQQLTGSRNEVTEDSDASVVGIRRRVREFVSPANRNLQQFLDRASLARHACHAELAMQLQPILNEVISQHRQDTFEQKRELAHTINHATRQLGLALKCPNTGRASILAMESRAREKGANGRYGFSSQQDEGRRKRTASRVTLESVDVIEAPERKEGIKLWSERSKSDRGAAERE